MLFLQNKNRLDSFYTGTSGCVQDFQAISVETYINIFPKSNYIHCMLVPWFSCTFLHVEQKNYPCLVMPGLSVVPSHFDSCSGSETPLHKPGVGMRLLQVRR